MLSTDAARFIAVAITALVLFGVGQAMGKFFSTWLESIARNPDADEKLGAKGMLGFALIESIGLFALVLACLILFH